MERELWLNELKAHGPDTAWDLFIERYHRLISAIISTFVDGYDDEMDVFTYTCEELRRDDLACLRKFAAIEGRVRFPTWLVAVVRNLVMDWFRRRDGRQRLRTAVKRLPQLQREAFELVFVEGWSPAEAYEIAAGRSQNPSSLGEFLGVLTDAQRRVEADRPGRLLQELMPGGRRGRLDFVSLESHSASVADGESRDSAALADRTRWLNQALSVIPDDCRVAVGLYVLDGLPADEVARLVGWRDSKAVYNGIYRSLASMRLFLEKQGISLTDLF